MKAKVRGGRLVLDEPTDLPEGAEVELVAVVEDELTGDDRRRLDADLARSREQSRAGALIDAHVVLDELEGKQGS